MYCDCPVYSSTPKVCQHSLAAAEDMGVLSDYLLWVGKIKGPALNLSNLIANKVPQSSGQKGSTSCRKGVPKGKKKPVLKELNGISNEDCYVIYDYRVYFSSLSIYVRIQAHHPFHCVQHHFFLQPQ